MSTSRKKVTIIDFQLGNLFSVKQACDTIGIQASIGSQVRDVIECDALILPGVGAFIEAMNNLKNLDLINPIKEVVKLGKPIMGICLGQQLLFTESEEFGSCKGLELIDGTIKKFPTTIDQRKIKVPQIGWNKVYKPNGVDWNNSPLMEVENNEFMYFVHSYYVQPASKDCIFTQTNYEGLEYCSSVKMNNIFATQFHPEKSALKGLSIYKNWAELNKLI